MKKQNVRDRQIFDSWPKISDGAVTAMWTDPYEGRRVYLIARPDGLFSSRCESFESFNNEMCWVTDRFYRSGCFYDSEEKALKETEFLHPWILDVPRQLPPK